MYSTDPEKRPYHASIQIALQKYTHMNSGYPLRHIKFTLHRHPGYHRADKRNIKGSGYGVGGWSIYNGLRRVSTTKSGSSLDGGGSVREWIQYLLL